MENNKENDTNLYKSKYPFTSNAMCSSRQLNSKVDTAEMEIILEFVATTIKKWDHSP